MKLLRFLLLSIFAIFPLGEIARFDLGKSIAISFHDVFIAVAFFVWIVILFKTKNYSNISKLKFFYPLVFFILVGAISLLLQLSHLSTSEFFTSLLYALRFIVYSSILFIVITMPEGFKKNLQLYMILCGSVVILFGFLQYFFYPDLRNLYYLGWDKHLYRMFSTFLDPNFAGVFFVLFFLYSLGFLLSIDKKKKTFLIFYSLITFFSFVAIFLSYSRSAILMLLISLPIFLYIAKKTKFLSLFLALSLVIFLLLPLLGKSEGTNLLRTASSMSRITSSQQAITIFKDNPILGVGFDAYRYAQKRYGFLPPDSWQDIHSGAGTDNSFLFVLATTGILGFLCYILFWSSLLREFIKIHNIQSAVVVSSIVGLFVGSLFINALFFPLLMEWMWLLIGTTYKEKI